jgi:hypothetical protein
VRLFLWSLGGDFECTFDISSVKNEALFMRPNTCVFTSGHAMYFMCKLLNNNIIMLFRLINLMQNLHQQFLSNFV